MPHKKSATETLSTPVELVTRKIYIIRGQRVMLDSDLAQLYQVETKALNRAVRRNADRFPEDFMFQLTDEEAKNLRYQIGTSGSGYRRRTRKIRVGKGFTIPEISQNMPTAARLTAEIIA
jgi:hypothetical protein